MLEAVFQAFSSGVAAFSGLSLSVRLSIVQFAEYSKS